MRHSFQSFDDFWPYYLGEHAHKETRALHIAGTAAGLLLLALAILSWELDLLVAALAATYVLAWTGHFVFEKNGPAAFHYPLWSLAGDLRMFWLWLTGGLEAELKRHQLPPARYRY